MIIEIILIILGILTLVLGVWNFVVGSYIWGSLFIIGGVWSIWLGVVYIIQLRKIKKNKNINLETKSVVDLSSPIVEIKPEPETEINTNVPVEIEVEPINEIDHAVYFTNEAIPNPKFESDNLDDYDSNTLPSLEEIDPDIEIMQDLVKEDIISEEILKTDTNKFELPNEEDY